MVEMPHRSVTRFFIPMIDVLTVLFSIYLLLPIVGTTDGGESEMDRAAREERLRQAEAELARRRDQGEGVTARLREEIEQLRREKIQALQNRLVVRVLEIDPKTGELFYRDPDRVEIRSQADAHRLIDRDQNVHRAARRELYYLILYPRDPASGYPTVEQKRNYDRWFEGVALGYDVPGSAGGKENRP